MEKDFEIIDHTADTGIIAYGADLKQVFANAARGMFSVITALDKIEEKEQQNIEVTAPDREALLVAWLNELIYLVDARGMLFHRFEITLLTDTRLKAIGFCEKIDLARHETKIQVKATTYHTLKITQEENGWKARVIFDV